MRSTQVKYTMPKMIIEKKSAKKTVLSSNYAPHMKLIITFGYAPTIFELVVTGI